MATSNFYCHARRAFKPRIAQQMAMRSPSVAVTEGSSAS